MDAKQKTVRELVEALGGFSPELEVFFRRVRPIAGNISEVVRVEGSEYSFFGEVLPCVIIETWEEEGLGEVGEGAGTEEMRRQQIRVIEKEIQVAEVQLQRDRTFIALLREDLRDLEVGR